MKIKWMPIKGHENYWVSNTGKLVSWKGKDPTPLKPATDRKGYLFIGFWDNGKRKAERVHRVVAKAFVPNPKNLPQVNHMDGNKKNNIYTNLEWCDNKHNAKHAYKMGLRKVPILCGSDCGKSKLTWADVGRIRLLRAGGCTYKTIAKEFGIDQSNVYQIVKGKTWKPAEGGR